MRFSKRFDSLMMYNPFVASNENWRKGRTVLTPLLTLFKVNHFPNKSKVLKIHFFLFSIIIFIYVIITTKKFFISIFVQFWTIDKFSYKIGNISNPVMKIDIQFFFIVQIGQINASTHCRQLWEAFNLLKNHTIKYGRWSKIGTFYVIIQWNVIIWNLFKYSLFNSIYYLFIIQFVYVVD